MTSLWVVVLGFNGVEDTLQCLASLAAVDGGPPNTVYVDNASAGDVPATVASAFPWCHVVRNATNDGYAGGNNRGIAYALERGANLVVILNNDTVVAPDLCTTLLGAANEHPDFGVLGPVIGFVAEPAVVMTDGCRLNGRNGDEFFGRQEVPLHRGAGASVHETEIVNGCCLMARAEVFRTIGMFDERFFLVHEESDFCLRTRAAGFRLGVVDRMLVWHKGSSSFKRTGRRLQRYFEFRNLALLLRARRPFGGVRRSAPLSWFAYWRYAYHVFCVEYEAGEPAAATAILEGIEDALLARTGPYRAGRRVLTWPLRQSFLLLRLLRMLPSSTLLPAALRRRP